MTITVAIADDHRLLLEGLSQALDQIPDIKVIGQAGDGEELLTLVAELQPDVVITDQDMPGTTGLEVLRRLNGKPPTIVVTMHADEEHRLAAEQAGAVGFLSKGAPLPLLAASVRAAAAGETFIESIGERSVIERFGEPVLDPGAESLTRRERELLGLLANGVSSTEDLAERMFISHKTVKNHLASIYEKLAVADRAQAAVEAIKLGIRG